MSDELYSIGHVARCFGARVSALRYYDEVGLLSPAERRGTVRYYGRVQLRRLALIQRLHRRGRVSVADTAVLLAEASDEDRPSGREVLTRSVRAMDEQIEDLQAAKRILEHLLECPNEDPVRQCTYLQDDLGHDVDAALEPESGTGQ